jgi:hypothetical protein
MLRPINITDYAMIDEIFSSAFLFFFQGKRRAEV